MTEPNSNDVAALGDDAGSLFSAGKYDQCLDFVSDQLSKDPNDFNSLSYKGTCLSKLGQYGDAINVLDQCLSINEDAFYIWVTRGDCFYELGDYQRAFSDYWISLQLAPENGAVMDKAARSLFRIGDKQYALDYIKKAVQLAESPEPVIVMIVMLKRMGYPNYAAEVARTAIKSFPSEQQRFEDVLRGE